MQRQRVRLQDASWGRGANEQTEEGQRQEEIAEESPEEKGWGAGMSVSDKLMAITILIMVMISVDINMVNASNTDVQKWQLERHNNIVTFSVSATVPIKKGIHINYMLQLRDELEPGWNEVNVLFTCHMSITSFIGICEMYGYHITMLVNLQSRWIA